MSRMQEDNLNLVYSGEGVTRTDIKVPVDISALNKVLVLNQKQWFKIQGQIDEIIDCEGRDVIQRIRDNYFYALDLDFDFDYQANKVFESYAKGTVSSVIGSVEQNRQYTLTVAATAGAYRIKAALYGNEELTERIPFNATAAQIKTALENNPIIKRGNVDVTGTGPFVIDLQDKLGGNASIVLTKINETDLSGGTVTLTQTQEGSTPRIELSETLGELPTFDLILCDKSVTNKSYYLHACAIDTRTITNPESGRVTERYSLLIRKAERMTEAFTAPDCVNPTRLRASEVAIQNAEGFAPEAMETVDTYSNNLIKDREAFGKVGGLVERWETLKPTSSLQVTYKGDVDHEEFIKLEDSQLQDAVYTTITAIYGLPSRSMTITRHAAIVGDADIQFQGDAKRSRFTVTYNTTKNPDSGFRESTQINVGL